mgnify:CR=1 FL=1
MSERVVDNPAKHGWVEVDGKWVWDASGGGAGAGMVISETEPTDKVEGMQWLNPTNGLVLFWDDEKWLQMPTTGAAGKDGSDGKDAVWSEDANGANYTGTVTVNGELLAAKADAGDNAVAVGVMAGNVTQGASSTAVGVMAGRDNQGVSAVSVGNAAGASNQGDYAVAIGVNSAGTDQGENSVAVGHASGATTQGQYATAVGPGAGRSDQGDYASALGVNAGEVTQGSASVAVGWAAGQTTQGYGAVAIGGSAGWTGQSDGAVAIGPSAGESSQGASSIAIGKSAGQADQAANGIIISSHGSAENSGNPNHIYIVSGSDKYLYYNGSDTWYFAGGTVTGPGLRFESIVQDGSPVIDAKGLIKTLSTLRKATMDETQDIRASLRSAIDELVAGFEHEIATQEISE